MVESSDQRPANCPHCGRQLLEVASDATLDYRPVTDASPTQPQAIADGGVSSSPPVDRVGNYRLLKSLGQGGMGVVWEAEQTGTGRRVALKLLSPRLRPTAENVERFLREGKSAASISHPRSTFVFDAGQQDGQPYIAMELMPGRTLKDELDESGPLGAERAVDCILDVIDGLEAAHALGVIHRDVKPSNCFIDSDGRIKIGDFGLSKSLVSDAELTKTGSFLGTPQFAAPEQVRGGAVDQRTDVYSVGATLFCLLTGRGPFVGDAAAVIAQIVSDSAPPLSSLRPEVRLSLSRIVARALEKDPNRRYQDLAGLRRALLPFATGGVSIADIGRRLAAYMLDSLLIGAVTSLVAFVYAMQMAVRTAAAGDPVSAYSPTMNASIQALTVTSQVLY
ncbi:MAG: protein kinase domain-containing protein, partial [Pirellulales bacterium]